MEVAENKYFYGTVNVADHSRLISKFLRPDLAIRLRKLLNESLKIVAR